MERTGIRSRSGGRVSSTALRRSVVLSRGFCAIAPVRPKVIVHCVQSGGSRVVDAIGPLRRGVLIPGGAFSILSVDDDEDDKEEAAEGEEGAAAAHDEDDDADGENGEGAGSDEDVADHDALANNGEGEGEANNGEGEAAAALVPPQLDQLDHPAAGDSKDRNE